MDLAIAHWKVVAAARRSLNRLKQTLAAMDDETELVELPSPSRSLKVENITVVAPGSGAVLLSEVGFELKAGEALGLIGPSGGGKTRWRKVSSASGHCCGAACDLTMLSLLNGLQMNWASRSAIFPRKYRLLDGTIAENIF